MDLQASDLRSESSTSDLASGSDAAEPASGPEAGDSAKSASPRRRSRSYKKDQTYRQVTDGWNRLRGRIEKHITKALARFPPERFQQAWELSQQQRREKRQQQAWEKQQQQQQQQQQQPSAEPALTDAGDRVPLRPDAAANPEEDFEEANTEQQQWNQPMAMLVMHAPHGKQSLFRSNELSLASSSIAHQAAHITCSALDIVADQQRVIARMEAMDLPQPRIGQLIESGAPMQKKEMAPSKQLRDKARKVFAALVKPQLNDASQACIRGPHQDNWKSCHFRQDLPECPAGNGCYSIRQKLAWPWALPMADPRQVAFSSAQNQLLVTWGQAQGNPAPEHDDAEGQLETSRTRADHSTALRGPAPRHAVVDPMPASQEAVDELLASLQLPVGPAEEYLELEGHLGHRTRPSGEFAGVQGLEMAMQTNRVSEQEQRDEGSQHEQENMHMSQRMPAHGQGPAIAGQDSEQELAGGRLNASHPGGPQLAAVHGTADRAALEDIGNLPALEADIPACVTKTSNWNKHKLAYVREHASELLARGPQGETDMPLLSLVDSGDFFPAWTLYSRDGNLLLRLMYRKLSWTNMSEYLDAAVIHGVSFHPLPEATHVICSITVPIAYIMSDESSFGGYKKAHHMVAAVTESTAANDRLYGFQAAKEQIPLSSFPGPKVLKSASCCKTAISIPLSRFVDNDVRCQWEASEKDLKAELRVLAPRTKAAVAVSWLWLDSCIKTRASKKH